MSTTLAEEQRDVVSAAKGAEDLALRAADAFARAKRIVRDGTGDVVSARVWLKRASRDLHAAIELVEDV